MKTSIKKLTLSYANMANKEVILQGWIRANRNQKEFGFINMNDGSNLLGVQIVYDKSLDNFNQISKLRVGSGIIVKGKIIITPKAKQPFEIKASSITLEGDCPANYPIQPKRHTREFLREHAHLRPRTNLFNACFRIRSLLAHAIHQFFHEKDFIYVQTPIITASDAEGAGEMFQVTTLNLENILQTKNIDYSQDFFGKPVNLTVSGQLEAEAFALSFKNVYTFGPTFRAEKSNTTRHAAEFWMIEPEMCFADLNDNMELIEEMLKYVISYILENAKEEMAFFDKYVYKGKIGELKEFINANIIRLDYREAINIFNNSKKNFATKIKYGDDLTTEHEKFLTDEYFHAPVFVINWPKDIKAFYMRLNDDNKTVAAVDLLVPGAGELVGGSQREERLDILIKRMKDLNIPQNNMEWYLDLRRYGGVYHSGFGLGFARLIKYVTGIENIRDVIPFPRTPNNCEF